MQPTYGSKWPHYATQWNHLAIHDSKKGSFEAIAHRLVAAKERYKHVESKTGVPWFMIAVIHEREASQNWNTQLAQGDPLHQVSRHVPAGEGPYSTWEEGAEFALKRFKHVIDWRLEKILFHIEAYNGWGYAGKGDPSPYLWAGTNQYVSGKYVADGEFSPSAVDTQPGCAALIKCMMELDPSIKPERETPEGVEPTHKPTPTPTPTTVDKFTWGDVFAALWQVLITLFGKKNV